MHTRGRRTGGGASRTRRMAPFFDEYRITALAFWDSPCVYSHEHSSQKRSRLLIARPDGYASPSPAKQNESIMISMNQAMLPPGDPADERP